MTFRTTVAIPLWRGERFLAACISSVLEAASDHCEILVVDDASGDASAEIVRRMANPRIRLFVNERRLGLAGNWNQCVKLARGEYVCIFHQDDVMLPKNLEKKMRVLEAHPHVGFVYSAVACVDGEGKPALGYFERGTPGGPVEIRKGSDFFVQLLRSTSNPICAPSVVARRECFERQGLFDERLPFTLDWEMWMRLCLYWDAAFIPEPLIQYRIHEQAASARFRGVRNHREAWRAKRIALARARAVRPDARELAAEVRRKYGSLGLNAARELLEQGRKGEAVRWLGFALRAQPALMVHRDTAWLLGKLCLRR